MRVFAGCFSRELRALVLPIIGTQTHTHTTNNCHICVHACPRGGSCCVCCARTPTKTSRRHCARIIAYRDDVREQCDGGELIASSSSSSPSQSPLPYTSRRRLQRVHWWRRDGSSVGRPGRGESASARSSTLEWV